MGFGLTNSPATFMSVLNDVLHLFPRKSVIILLDDILVFRRLWREPLQQLDAVLLALEEESLFCNPVKCQFCLSEVKFFGHVVSWLNTFIRPRQAGSCGKVACSRDGYGHAAVPWVYKLFPPLH